MVAALVAFVTVEVAQHRINGDITENEDSAVHGVSTISNMIYSQHQKILAMDGGGREEMFGQSLDTDGKDTLVVGAFMAGKVYVYRRRDDMWIQQQILRGGPWFGYAVALCNDRLVVGAPGNIISREHLGEVILYTRHDTDSPFLHNASLRANDTAVGDAFGDSVACISESIIVGAKYRAVHGMQDAGAGTECSTTFYR
jgi:hypothetical protein